MKSSRTPLSLAIATIIFGAGLNAAPVIASTQTATTSPRVEEVSVDADQALQERISVFVQLIDEPAASVFVAERDRFVASNRFLFAGSPDDLKAAAERQAADSAMLRSQQLQVSQQAVIQALVNRFDAHILFNARFAENGIAVRVPQSAIAGLRTIPGVKSVSLLATHETHAVSSIDFTGARTFWGTVAPDLNLRGAAIGVGVIDSGIDHMHTEFAGPGGTAYAPGATTTSAYPAPPTVPVTANFPTPKVIWGYDFVGDAYSAGGTTDAALIPLPDNNTMDTGGHGTSVASLIGGIGVNNDGTTYAGAHDRTQPNILTNLRISPGYAPASSLYAFRVFGTAGSSAVVASALDAATAVYIWQANPANAWDGALTGTVFNAAGQAQTVNYNMPQPPQTPRLRVINLSLGSNSGDIEEASSQAAQRAADAGLIVVLSAGNADDTYYITGSPGVAAGGISVAASFNDQFPGGVANAPANGGQPALTNFAITQFGTASFSSAANSLPLTDTVWARPNLADNTAAAPAGYTPPIVQPPGNPPVNDLSPLVTLLDGTGQPINLFSVDGSNNLIVTMNPAVTNNPYSGKLVLIDRGVVGFHQKSLAAARAGAAGVMIASSTTAAIGSMGANVNLPTIAIPSVLVTQAVGGLLADGGALNTGVARTVAARPGLQIAMSPTNRGSQDTMAAYSSRGPRRVDEGIKPDITAPAENVTVALVNTGNGVSGFNGTSSAAPHTAGAMALLYNLNPTWTNYELKSLLLNSAANNVFTTGGPDIFTPPTGQIWGVTRQGAGRWDLSRYANGGNSVIMFGVDPAPTDGGANRTGTVNVSFGVFDVLGTVTQDRTVTVRNKSATTQTFTAAFRPVTETPGVSFSFPNGPAVIVPGNGQVSFPVRITADAAAMRHARDLSLRPFQFITAIADANRRPRQFMNEASGFIELTPTVPAMSPASHRLTVQAFPRRASDLALTATPPVAGTPTSFLFAGVGYNTGASTAFIDLTTFSVAPSPVDIVSFAKGFELSYLGEPTPSISTSQRGADVSHVGITSDFASRATPFDPAATNNQSTVLVFAVAAHGQFDSPEAGFGDEYQIDIDSNRDGTTDRMVRQFNFTNGERTNSRTNIMLPVVSSAPPFTAGTTTGFNLNILSNVYTNLFNNSVLTIPVQVSGGAGSLGLTAATANIRYRVRGLHRGVQVSQTPWLDYNVTTPGISFPGINEPAWTTPISTGQALGSLNVLTNEAGMQANVTRGLLMIYPMNAAGDRTQVNVAGFRSVGIMKDGFE